MFRHQGKNRTFIHNLRLATLLSFVAGIVNVTGVLSIQTLTTNVTGHFAYFAEEIMKRDYEAAITFFVFTIFPMFYIYILYSQAADKFYVGQTPDVQKYFGNTTTQLQIQNSLLNLYHGKSPFLSLSPIQGLTR